MKLDPFDRFDSGFRVYKKNSRLPIILSGESTLDELIGGGFHKDLVYLLYGDKKKTTSILLTTAVNSQKALVNGGMGMELRLRLLTEIIGLIPTM